MKTTLLCFCLGTFLFSCTGNEKKTATASEDKSAAANTDKTAVDLPYTASFSSNWTTDVSDADLKMVLMTYKDWGDGNIASIEKVMGDTVTVDMSSGYHIMKPKADIVKMWGTYRDSL